MPTRVLVCQNTTCQQQGSKQVRAALQKHAPPEIKIEVSGCLGQCGNGPMALVLPEKVWYHRLRPQDAGLIAAQHLGGNRPVACKLYPAIHGPQKSILIWVVGLGLFLGLCILLAYVVGARAKYVW